MNDQHDNAADDRSCMRSIETEMAVAAFREVERAKQTGKLPKPTQVSPEWQRR
jgi:hypothetical protein